MHLIPIVFLDFYTTTSYQELLWKKEIIDHS